MIILIPLIPHIAYESMQKLDHKICYEKLSWPNYKEKLLKEKDCNIVIQINGKKRGIFNTPIDLEESAVVEKAKNVNNIKKNLDNKKIIKQIYIKNKLINFII